MAPVNLINLVPKSVKQSEIRFKTKMKFHFCGKSHRRQFSRQVQPSFQQWKDCMLTMKPFSAINLAGPTGETGNAKNTVNKGIGDAGSTADIRMLCPWSALVCLGLL